MERTKALLPVFAFFDESLTAIVTVVLPACVGVPEMTPLDERLRPAGSAPSVTCQEYGAVPPEPVSACE
jgi:hypothetical protein